MSVQRSQFSLGIVRGGMGELELACPNIFSPHCSFILKSWVIRRPRIEIACMMPLARHRILKLLEVLTEAT